MTLPQRYEPSTDYGWMTIEQKHQKLAELRERLNLEDTVLAGSEGEVRRLATLAFSATRVAIAYLEAEIAK